jgi:integrase/recombinase XerD
MGAKSMTKDPLKNPPEPIKKYLKIRIPKYAPKTQPSKRSELRQYLRWLNGQDPHKITALTLEEFLTECRDENSDGTTRQYASLLRDYYQWAHTHYNTDNIAAGLDTKYLSQKTARSEHLDEEVEYLETDEMRDLIDATKNTREYLVIKILLDTGARAGELRRLKTTQTDYKTQIINIPNSKEMLKEHDSRPVPLLPDLEDEIRTWTNIDRYSHPHPNSPYLIPGKQSPQIRTEEIGDIVRTAAKKAGIQEMLNKKEYEKGEDKRPLWRVRPHTCRHTYAVQRVLGPSGDGSDGVDIAILADWLGHKNINTTRDKYLSFKTRDYRAVAMRTAPRY